MAVAEALLICLVIGIADGDTLIARCELPAGAENIKVRLAEIDAPERGQAFGSRSKQHLSDICFKKPAEVWGGRWAGKDWEAWVDPPLPRRSQGC